MLGFVGIIVSLGLLMWLAYKGWSVILIAPLLALVAVIFQMMAGGNGHLLATYTEVFMSSLAGYIRNYFPLFMLGAVFGKIMDDSGSAKSIARFITQKIGTGKEILAVVLSCAILTYGGISLFVVVFAIYPIGAGLFREANIPKRLLPPAIALGAFTFTMTAIPGTPQIQNAIPMKYFGTDPYAAPVLGIIATLIMFGIGVFWLESRLKAARSKGEGYGNYAKEDIKTFDTANLPSIIASIVPIVMVLLSMLFFSKILFPQFIFPDASSPNTYLAEYTKGLLPSGVIGNWSLILGLILGILMVIILNFKRMGTKNIPISLKDGVQGSFLAVMNTASEVGYGNTIKTMAAFSIIAAGLTGISSNPLILAAISNSLLAGVTGSASGGMSIALEAFGKQLLEMANTMGIRPEALHRISAIACGGLDTLPHNGAVITLLGITGITHKESYPNIGMCTVIIPTFAVAVIIVLATLGIN